MGQFFESHRTQLHITMYKLIVLAVVLVAASAQVLPAGYAPYPYAAGAYAAGALPVAHAGLAYPYAAGVPVPAPAPVQYALPPPREVVEAPIVSQTVEKVEQHGYSIRYQKPKTMREEQRLSLYLAFF